MSLEKLINPNIFLKTGLKIGFDYLKYLSAHHNQEKIIKTYHNNEVKLNRLQSELEKYGKSIIKQKYQLIDSEIEKYSQTKNN